LCGKLFAKKNFRSEKLFTREIFFHLSKLFLKSLFTTFFCATEKSCAKVFVKLLLQKNLVKIFVAAKKFSKNF